MTDREAARREFREQVRKSFERSDQAFRGEYADAINELLALSRADVDSITPGVTDLETYDRLITVVKEASRANLAQAELKRHIEDLGEVAVGLARMVPGLSKLL